MICKSLLFALKNASRQSKTLKVKKTVTVLSLALAAIFSAAADTNAADFIAKVSGNWDNPTVWNSPATTGPIPGASDRVFINPGIVLTVNSNVFKCQDLIFKSQTSGTPTSKLVVDSNLGSTFKFIVSGTITVESAVSGNDSYNTAILEGNIQAANLDVKGNKSGPDKFEAKLMVNPGGKLSVSGNITFTGNGSTSDPGRAFLDIKGNAELEIAGTLGGSSANLNFNETSIPTSKVTFTGGASQAIPSGPIKYGTINISNSKSFTNLDDTNFDAKQVIIGANTESTVSGAIKINKINLLVEGTLRLTGANSEINGESNTSFVKLGENGALIIENIGAGTGNRGATTAVLFPVGSATSNSYTPAVIVNSGTARNFTLTLSDVVTKPGATVTNNIVNKTWNITPSGNGVIAALTLQWNISDEAKFLSDPSKSFNRGNCAISHWDAAGDRWEQNGVTMGAAVQVTAGTTWKSTRTNVTSFSPFAVADATGPLPVELVSFKAVKKNAEVLLTWETASEKNNIGFEVQSSTDGKNYERIGFVASANGTSSSLQRYAFTDKASNKEGLAYYRLKQIDLDGTFEFFASKVVDLGRTGSAVSAYPNPFQNQFAVSLTSAVAEAAVITVTDMTGKTVYTTTAQLQKGTNTLNVTLKDQPAGIYMLNATAGNQTYINRLVKQ